MPKVPRFNALQDREKLELTRLQSAEVWDPLISFLHEHKPRIGQVLFGRVEGIWSEKDARDVERLVCDVVDNRRMRRDFLRVLRKAAAFHALSVKQPVFLPDIPVLPPKRYNPHDFNLGLARRRYDAWKQALTAAILALPASETGERSASLGFELVLASAMLFGGLLNLRYLIALVRAFPEANRRTLASEKTLHVELTLSRGLVRKQLFRWQPDALTATLWLLVPDNATDELLADVDGQPCSDDHIRRRIVQLLLTKFVRVEGADQSLLRGVGALKQSVEAIARLEMPDLVLSVATRDIVCQSVPRAALNRLLNRGISFLSPFESEEEPNGCSDEEIYDNVRKSVSPDLDPDEVQRLRSIMNASDVNQTRSRLQALHDEEHESAFVTRMADFADSLLAVRTYANKRWTVKGVRNIATILCRHLAPYFDGGADPAGKSTDDLEKLYGKVIEGLGRLPEGSSMLSDLARAVRQFHRYLIARANKLPLSDPTLLTQYIDDGQVDSNIVAKFEFDITLADIEKWPVEQRELENAQSLCDFAYCCSLRRCETSHSQIEDVLVPPQCLPEELLVIPNESRGLKSHNAERRAILTLLTSVGLERFTRIYHRRIEQDNAGPKDFIFVGENGQVMPDSTSDSVNKALSQRTGRRTHLHSLRHTLGSTGLTSLNVIGLNVRSRLLDELEPATREWMYELHGKLRALYGHNLNSGKHAYLVTQVMGQGSPEVLCTNYWHLADYTLKAYLDNSRSMRPDPKLVEAASGQKRTTVQGWMKSGDPMEIPLMLFHKRAAALRRSAGQPVRVAESNVDEPLARPWIYGAYDFQLSVEVSGRPLSEIANRFSVRFNEAQQRTRRACYIRDLPSGRGYRHRVEQEKVHGELIRLACPIRPELRQDKKVVEIWAPKLAVAANSVETRAVTQHGLQVYIDRIWHEENLVVFHSLDEATEVLAYLESLLILGFQKQEIRFVSFDQRDRSRARAAWRKALTVSNQSSGIGLSERDLIEKVTPPSDAECTEWWFGVGPRFNTASNPNPKADHGSFGFRFVMTMGYIVFGGDEGTN